MPPKKQHITYARKINEFIEAGDNFILSGHMNADGDAIASAIAMRLLIEKLGKKATLVFHDRKFDQRFNYLKDFDQIISCQDKDKIGQLTIENAIILDAPGYGRLGDVSDYLPSKENVIKIDHHPIEDIMGIIDWVDMDASSTTVLVYEVIECAGISIDSELATAVFTGIVYDTGRFSFSNTTERDFEVCAKMVSAGAMPSEIANSIFFENSFNALKTIGKGLYSLENYLDGFVNVIYLGYEEMQNNDQSEIEELANYSVAIRGGKVGLFIREIKPNFHKISFRSHSNIDVNVVAKAFDGGGHSRAAGCRIEGNKVEIVDKIINEIKKQL